MTTAPARSDSHDEERQRPGQSTSSAERTASPKGNAAPANGACRQAPLYAEHTSAAEGGTGERLVAERLTDQVRVVASATNGFEGPGNHWDITRPEAVLSVDQLAAVVSQPWWGFELPAEYAGERDVPTYTDIPCCITAESAPQD